MSEPEAPGRPPGSGWAAWAEQACRRVEADGQWRRPRSFDALGPTGLLEGAGGDADGGSTPGSVVSFASNDYLGLSLHPAVIAAAHHALDRWGAGSGASRLVTGSRPVHRQLEGALASWKGCERSLLLPTGFAANLAVLSVFGTEGSHLFSDALNHASIIDGTRLARGQTTVYPHRDLDHLDAALDDASGRPLIVTDTVFSMDGDEADLDRLVAMAARHGALLVLDEAHAVLGPDLPPPAHGRVDVLRVGTLSKTLGSLGGFVAGPARFIELLENRARPYIFTTAGTPADAAAALAALEILRSPEGEVLCSRLAHHVSRVNKVVGGHTWPTPIIPVVIGEEAAALEASAALLRRGLWVPAIRPPTVPHGASRLRITLSASHRDDQIDRLTEALVDLGLDGLAAADRTRGGLAS
jgi:8-amino-7-oxononanoate synthase